MTVENTSEDLYLLFPQWQGLGRTNELYTGAMTLYQSLKQILTFAEVRVEPMVALQQEHDIVGYAQIVDHLQQVRTLLIDRNPHRIFSIGGDCGIEVAPVSFLNKQYDGDMALIWLDAHADANTPQSSPSHTFHGMVLRTLLGDGDHEIISQSFSSLHPRQVFLAGVRDLDPPEARFVEQQNLTSFTCDQLTNNVQALIAAIQTQSFTRVYLHIDVDVLDPASFPYLKHPTPNGLTVETLMHIRQALLSSFHVVGGSIVEFTPPQEDVRAIEQLKGLYTYPYPLQN